MIGKRKRESAARAPFRASPEVFEADNGDDTQSHDIFRKHFEAKFKALPFSTESVVNDAEGSETEDGGTSDGHSDWEGLSDAEDDPPVVEVVHVANELQDHEVADKARAKAFMVRCISSYFNSGQLTCSTVITSSARPFYSGNEEGTEDERRT